MFNGTPTQNFPVITVPQLHNIINRNIKLPEIECCVDLVDIPAIIIDMDQRC